MKNKKAKLLPICFLLALLGSLAFHRETLPAPQKSFLWKIQSQTTTAYVLGSLHYSKKEMYPLSEKIEKAFGESSILIVEADVNDVKKFDIQKFAERALYPENDTLEKHVSPEIYERVVKETSGLGIPIELLNKQKPWFLAMTLAAFESLKLGFDPNLGIDKYFLSKAEGRKKILELESLDYQFNLLSEFSDKDQELFLLYTLKDLKVMEEELGRLTQAWTSGDTKTMEAILTRSASEDKRLSFIFEKLIYERNRKMASKIEDFLRTSETYFVVVGAGHLVGDRGIIDILKGKGYRIEQL
ncbi:MAG TPA: TraB/GumN family protein [Thermodesulfobacteriota bacterium]|nr:TraB/GumN family protein [Thermodesulfobacteriota bacterium]